MTKDLKNSAGAYVKSVCSVYQDMIYDSAASTCIANGMTLFDSNTADMDNALLSYSNTQWPWGSFWIAGRGAFFCSAMSDSLQTLFTKQNLGCLTFNYFNCEFIGKY